MPPALELGEPFVSHRRQKEGLRLRCLVFDSRGKAVSGTQVYPRSTFCHQHGLQSRDLRKIDANVDNSVPTLLVRRGGILINILHIRGLIKHDAFYLFETAAAAHRHAMGHFTKNLQDRLSDGLADTSARLPFEFKVLEAVLSSVVSQLEEEWHDARRDVTETLAKLETHIDSSHLRGLLTHQREMAVVQKRVVAVRELIDDLLGNDEDLSDMYLTRAAVTAWGHTDEDEEHAEVEQLLESYGTQVEETENAIQALSANVQGTFDVIELILDSSRNGLLALDLKVSIVTSSLTSGALVAAFFGMNLHTGLEQHPEAFVIAASSSLALTALIASAMFRHLRRLRRVGLGTGTFGQLPSKPKRLQPGDEVFLTLAERKEARGHF